MWQSPSRLGTARLYAKAGDKCVVQYYGTKAKYPSEVLDESEDASFANMSICTSTGRVNEMSLDVAVQEGESLEVGVKSGYGQESNNVPGAGHGKFYLDQVRVCKVGDLPVEYGEHSVDNNVMPRKYSNRIVLHKSFANGEWQTLCLPFSLNYEDVQAIFGAGTTIEGSDSIKAGVPCRILPTDVLPSPIVLEGVKVETAQAETVVGETEDLVGTFNATDQCPAFSAYTVQH